MPRKPPTLSVIPASPPTDTPGRGVMMRGRLRTSAELMREMGRVYRAVRTGKLESQEGTRLVYILDRMQHVIDSALLEERLERLERNAQTR